MCPIPIFSKPKCFVVYSPSEARVSGTLLQFHTAIVQNKCQGSPTFRTLNPSTVNLISCQYEEFSGRKSVRYLLSLQALLTRDDVKHFRTRMYMDRGRRSVSKQG
jgi:hypothetical protein